MKKDMIFVAGATGYIGARLIPQLLSNGIKVKALARSLEKLKSRPWSSDPNLQIVSGDMLSREDIISALKGCSVAYYLVHSMSAGKKDFSDLDRLAAKNMQEAAEETGLIRIIYLSGLGTSRDQLSEHLKSRREVELILRQGSVPVTILRAAMIIGSGSASFEILRYLVERLPVMITPKWVSTKCQPICITNVIEYLIGCLNCPETTGETFDIGQEKPISYRDLMQIYAKEAGLRARLIISVPLLTPRLSSYWIHLVTPVPKHFGRLLAEGLSNEVICIDDRIRSLIPLSLVNCDLAIRRALDEEYRGAIESSWLDAGALPNPEGVYPGDPSWAGGALFKEAYSATFDSTANDLWKLIVCIGGDQGWYHGNLLWRLRGFADRLLGGVGLQRGRKCPKTLSVGDVVDFWRVVKIQEGKLLCLYAEMKIPGHATLEFQLTESEGIGTALSITARYCPKGLPGTIYWYAVSPFHDSVFKGMLKEFASSLKVKLIKGPEKV